MEKALNALGIYNIIHASNGREALVLIDEARETEITLILLFVISIYQL